MCFNILFAFFILIISFKINAQESKSPNIVIIIADDLGIGDVGCFGNTTLKTPNIDRIAREGARLNHHIAADALCSPSRAALLTGRYPIRTGMNCEEYSFRVSLFVSGRAGLPQEEITVADLAKQHNYATKIVGKWHMGLDCDTKGDACHHPMSQGFDEFYGSPMTNFKDYGDDGAIVLWPYRDELYKIMTNTAIVSAIICLFIKWKNWLRLRTLILLNLLWLVPCCISLLTITNIKFLNSMIMRNHDVVEQPIRFKNLTQRFVAEGVKFIEAKEKEQRPFLLVMSWLQVHTVLHSAKEFKDKTIHGQYGDNVEEMDWSTGEIINALDRLNLLDNTLVYFTSDNGGFPEETGLGGDTQGGYNGIYRGGKGQSAMDGGIRVPAAIMWRGRIPPGIIVDTPTSLMDIFPTLQEGVFNTIHPKTDPVLDGRNILPLLSGNDSTPPHRLLVHYCCREILAIRYTPTDGSDVYKIYYMTPTWLPGKQRCRHLCPCYGSEMNIHDPPLLYNIQMDPSEKNEILSTDPIYRLIIAEADELLRKHKASIDLNVEPQMTVLKNLPRIWMQPCCNFPSCNCVDPVYENITLALS